jgi:uncharacterized protein YceH (UPF0502 family)
MSDVPSNPPAELAPKWKPLSSIDRRVLGVLIEKAKTTPDSYPLSLNAICTGCNQKSNRFPLMSLEPEDVEESLDRLREWGAVGIIQGMGRVSKYRHYAYEWFGVDKVELAVMGELLLRGAQTEGELRGRASRMEPIAGLPELRPVLASLKSKGLVLPLTPEGRGHTVTHALFLPREIEKLQAQYQHSPQPSPAPPSTSSEAPSGETRPAPASPISSVNDDLESLKKQLFELRDQVVELRDQLETLLEAQQRSENELRELRDALGG